MYGGIPADVSPNEKRTRMQEIYDFHASQIDALAGLINRPIYAFFTKVPFMNNGKRVVGLFQSELEQDRDLYFELTTKNIVPIEEDRCLYRLRYSADIKSRFSTSPDGQRHLVPVEEMERVWCIGQVISKAPQSFQSKEVQKPVIAGQVKTPVADFTLDLDDTEDLKIDRMTVRDLIAILTKKPVSTKEWLNKLVTTL
jgi:hypothetical protein